jgi:hypothetical protein
LLGEAAGGVREEEEEQALHLQRWLYQQRMQSERSRPGQDTASIIRQGEITMCSLNHMFLPQCLRKPSLPSNLSLLF